MLIISLALQVQGLQACLGQHNKRLHDQHRAQGQGFYTVVSGTLGDIIPPRDDETSSSEVKEKSENGKHKILCRKMFMND